MIADCVAARHPVISPIHKHAILQYESDGHFEYAKFITWASFGYMSWLQLELN